MKSVGYLHSVGCSLTTTFSVGTGTITTDEFGRVVLAKPGTQTVSCAIRQKIHHFTGSDVHQHRAEPMTTTQREIIDAEDRW